MPVQAVIFDRDGVLTSFDFVRADAFFRPRLPFALSEIVSRWKIFGQRMGFPRSVAEEQEFFAEFWNSCADECSSSNTVREELLGFDYTTCMAAFPDARPALETARRAGLRTGVLSNFSLASLDRSLEKTGLADLIDHACAATVIGVSKPSAKAYLFVAEQLGVIPTECLFLDDEALCVEGARAVGMHAYLVDRRGAREPSEFVVSGLDALPGLLQSHATA